MMDIVLSKGKHHMAAQGLRYDQLISDYRLMRETNPVNYNEHYNLWQVFRYQDVQQVMSDPATFSSHHRELSGHLQRKD